MGSEDNSDDSAGRAEARDAWLEHYRIVETRTGFSGSIPRLTKYALYQRAVIRKTIEQIDARKASGRSVSIWSAGSGIDTISLYLKSARTDATRIVVQDISNECISLNKSMFSSVGLEAEFVVGDLFQSRNRDEFDIVINTGLLEHFKVDDQRRLVEVFSTALKPGGVYITATPFAGAKAYMHFKSRLEKLGKWSVGPEMPIRSLSDLQSRGFVLVEEKEVGASDQLILAKNAYPLMGRAIHRLARTLMMFPAQTEPPLLRLFGGYCLLDIFVKTTEPVSDSSISSAP